MVRFTSILFPRPGAVARAEAPAEPDFFPDLHLDQIVAAVTTGHADDHLDQFFYEPLHEVSAITYRHEVFRDLDCDETRRPIENFVAGMRTTRSRLHQAEHLRHPLQQHGWFLYAVGAFCDATATLRDDLAGLDLTSSGLRDFADYVAKYVDGDSFQTLVADTQATQAELHKVRYLVHIQGLRVHVEKFNGQTDYSVGVAETFERFATEAGKDYHVHLKNFADMDNVEEQVLDCVAKLYPRTFALLDSFCSRNADFVEPAIARFEREVHFYLSYLAFVRRFTAAGLTFGYPDVTTKPGVVCETDDSFDLALAIKSVDEDKSVVTNSFRLCGPERIFVVTGPNQGGKTTFARAIGQCAYLAALGCPVPARRAVLTLPDQIYTHFERQESLSTLRGKLDDELVRIHDILSQATAASVIVMNESFSSTTVNDALLIGTEVLERLIALRCVAVYVSFLDELASFDPACVSMVGEVEPDDPTQRTFTFIRRPADGLAYAAALADKYHLTHDVLRRRITQ